MLRKDYLLRFLNDLFEALQKIKKKVGTNIEDPSTDIANAYNMLGKDVNFFLDNEIDVLIDFFNAKNNEHLESIKYLAELLYYDSLIQSNKGPKEKMLLKARELINYFNNNSTTYDLSSFQLSEKIAQQLVNL
ncbi:hypothetical protein [Galbibacter sp. PAP.153]|uniref:hypothetical protein n=1 Tax=Galbibacter sp. PAP.153 TaxID=3104623 RepID=UPI00300A38C2